MNKKFEMLEVMRSLGIAPSTASVIAGLLNGEVDPENFRSVEFWFAGTFEAPPQHRKVLAAVAELLGLGEEDVKEEGEVMYLEQLTGQPAVVWADGGFSLREI